MGAFGTSSSNKTTQSVRNIDAGATASDYGISSTSYQERSGNNKNVGNINVAKGGTFTSNTTNNGVTADALTQFSSGLAGILKAQGASTGTGLMSGGMVEAALQKRTADQIADAGATDSRKQSLIILGVLAALLILAAIVSRRKK